MTSVLSKQLPVFSFALALAICSSFIEVDRSLQDLFNKLTSSIAIGSAEEIINHCYSSVELETPESRGIYSKSQAEQILKRFFDQHPPQSFELEHQGYSNSGSKFAVGKYTDTGDETFRLSIFAKKNEGIYQVHELRFE